MDEKNNQELSVEELLARLKSDLMGEDTGTEKPESKETPEASEAPEVSEVPEVSETPEVQEEPEVSAEPEIEDAAEPATDEAPAEPETAEEEPKEAVSPDAPLGSVDENEIFAAWGLSPDDMDKTRPQTEAAQT